MRKKELWHLNAVIFKPNACNLVILDITTHSCIPCVLLKAQCSPIFSKIWSVTNFSIQISFLFCKLFCVRQFHHQNLIVCPFTLSENTWWVFGSVSLHLPANLQELAWALTISNKHLEYAHLFWTARVQWCGWELTSGEEPQDHSGCQIWLH